MCFPEVLNSFRLFSLVSLRFLYCFFNIFCVFRIFAYARGSWSFEGGILFSQSLFGHGGMITRHRNRREGEKREKFEKCGKLKKNQRKTNENIEKTLKTLGTQRQT